MHLTFVPKSCQDLLNDAEQSMMEYKKSIESLKKESKYTLDKIAIGESDLQRGRTDLRYFTFSLSRKSLFFSMSVAVSFNNGLSPTYCKIIACASLQIYWEADPISYRFHLQSRIYSCRC